jgi:hypothetical protein
MRFHIDINRKRNNNVDINIDFYYIIIVLLHGIDHVHMI